MYYVRFPDDAKNVKLLVRLRELYNDTQELTFARLQVLLVWYVALKEVHDVR
jgi:hypothetical protein